MNPALILAEEIVDWILQENCPQKESLKVFRLGLTQEGLAILNAILNVLNPVLYYQSSDGDYLISSKFPHKTLLQLASIAVKDFPND